MVELQVSNRQIKNTLYYILLIRDFGTGLAGGTVGIDDQVNDRMINGDRLHSKLPGEQRDNLRLGIKPVGMYVGNLVRALQSMNGQPFGLKFQPGKPPRE